jgi:hypothetical protein
MLALTSRRILMEPAGKGLPSASEEVKPAACDPPVIFVLFFLFLAAAAAAPDSAGPAVPLLLLLSTMAPVRYSKSRSNTEQQHEEYVNTNSQNNDPLLRIVSCCFGSNTGAKRPHHAYQQTDYYIHKNHHSCRHGTQYKSYKQASLPDSSKPFSAAIEATRESSTFAHASCFVWNLQ